MDFDKYLGKLDELIEFARKNGLTSFSGAVDGFPVQFCFSDKAVVSSVVIEPEEAIAPIQRALDANDGAGICECGHSWLEHTEAGCLHGCSHELCTSGQSSPQEP